MDEDRDLYHAVREIYDTGDAAGTLLEHAPDATSFPDLAALARTRRWNRHFKLFNFLD